MELGQGIATALAQIAAEELDVALERIRLVQADTARSPDEGGTTGSRSLEVSGNAIRLAAAAARQHLLSLAFEHLESQTPADALEVSDGVITDPASGKRVDYWQLLAGRKFGGAIGNPPAKSPASHRLVGQPAQRIDLPGKVIGAPSYVHDMDLPGMLHARVLRPPGYHARLLAFDAEAIQTLPGVVAVIRDGQFIAVVAEREWQAVRAVDEASSMALWEYAEELPPAENIFHDLRAKPAQSNLIVDGEAVERSDSAFGTRASLPRNLSPPISNARLAGSIGVRGALGWRATDCMVAYPGGIYLTRRASASFTAGRNTYPRHTPRGRWLLRTQWRG